jgi:hypothetical protein
MSYGTYLMNLLLPCSATLRHHIPENVSFTGTGGLHNDALNSADHSMTLNNAMFSKLEILKDIE